MTWKIVKKGYSRNPWRIVTEHGQELETVCAKTGIVMSVSGQTRAEVEAWLLDRCEWYARCARAGVLPPTYSPNWRNEAYLRDTAHHNAPQVAAARQALQAYFDIGGSLAATPTLEARG